MHEVEKRFQPGIRIGQAVDIAGKGNNDVIIVYATTSNMALSTPENRCEETVIIQKQMETNKQPRS